MAQKPFPQVAPSPLGRGLGEAINLGARRCKWHEQSDLIDKKIRIARDKTGVVQANSASPVGMRSRPEKGKDMNLAVIHIGPLVALIAGILILIMPRLLNYIVALYLIIIGIIGLFGVR